jgi:2-keto-4-pentenoate hydratase/2-oxohepta-3-ene-1,7-dioic acid hydratase in catechol pathway
MSRPTADFAFMKPGDVVEIEVDAIGILRNGIRDE